MNIAILGGTGFIGSHLTRFLLERGDYVLIPTRSPEKHRASITVSEGVTGTLQYKAWDGHDAEQLASLLKGMDGVVNLIGENIAAHRWTQDQKQRILNSRIQAGKALAAAFALLPVRPAVLLQASAVGWYGSWPDMDKAPLCTEERQSGNGFLAETAVAWEASTAGINQDYPEVRRCIIRTAPVLGAGGGMLQPLLPLFRYGLGGVSGSGRQPFSWIHLDDEIAAIVFLLDHGNLKGVFNLAAPHPISNRAFVNALGRRLNRPTWIPVPAFALRAFLGEMADQLILTGQRALPERLMRDGFRFRHSTIESALEQILPLPPQE